MVATADLWVYNAEKFLSLIFIFFIFNQVTSIFHLRGGEIKKEVFLAYLVYMCVVVCITVVVWECCRGACEAVARVMTAVKREQLSSSLQELTILPCCLLQKYINFVLLSAHFNVQLASWWLFIQGQCFLPNQGLNDFLFGLANCWQCYFELLGCSHFRLTGLLVLTP